MVQGQSRTQKCWAVSPPGDPANTVLLWELRRFLDIVWERSVEVHHFLRKFRDEFVEDLGLAGLCPDDEIMLSAKAWRARSSDPPPPHLQEEYQISSEGLVCLLARWSSARRLAKHRSACASTLQSLMASCLTDGRATEVLTACPAIELLQQCDCFDESRRGCAHFVGVYDAVNRHGQAPQMLVAELVALLAQHAGCCAAIKAWLAVLLPFMCHRFVDRVTSEFEDDPLQARPDSLCTNSRKRRIDSDLKTAVVMDAMAKRRAMTPGAYATATGEYARSTAATWQPVLMGQYRAACFSELGGGDIYAVAFDASRLGQPKEETLMLALSLPLQGRAGWLPPQVIVWGAFVQSIVPPSFIPSAPL